MTALKIGRESIRIRVLRQKWTGRAKIGWMTDTPKKRGPKPGNPHRGRKPESLGEYLNPLPTGHVTKQMRISGTPEAIKWFDTLGPRVRGEIVTEAHAKIKPE